MKLFTRVAAEKCSVEPYSQEGVLPPSVSPEESAKPEAVFGWAHSRSLLLCQSVQPRMENLWGEERARKGVQA